MHPCPPGHATAYSRFWPFFFVLARKWHYFNFRSEICCHHRSQWHRFPIKLSKFWRIDNVLANFWSFWTRRKKPAIVELPSSGYNSDNDFLNKRGTFRKSEYSFSSLWQCLPRNLPFFYLRSTWPNILKTGHMLPAKGDNFYQIWSWSDHPLSS